MNIMLKCPKYYCCNAPLCPLDEKKHLRVRLTGEDNCPYNIEKVREIKKTAKVSDNFRLRPNGQMVKVSHSS